MEKMNQQQDQIFGGPLQMELPNATGILVLGILAIVGSFCYFVPGIVCGIIAIFLASKAKRVYYETPGRYTEASYKNMNAGRICAIIGLCLALLLIIITVVVVIFFSMTMSNYNWH